MGIARGSQGTCKKDSERTARGLQEGLFGSICPCVLDLHRVLASVAVTTVDDGAKPDGRPIRHWRMRCP